MDYKQGVVALTENKEVLERLRGMRAVKKFFHHNEPVKDEKGVVRDNSGAVVMTPVFKEGYQAQFNGQFIVFFVGEPRTLPENVADSLERSNVTILTERCPQCKGNGFTTGGALCGNCRGRKRMTKVNEDDQIMNYRILKVLRRYDAMLVDPETTQPINLNPQTVEAASAAS